MTEPSRSCASFVATFCLPSSQFPMLVASQAFAFFAFQGSSSGTCFAMRSSRVIASVRLAIEIGLMFGTLPL